MTEGGHRNATTIERTAPHARYLTDATRIGDELEHSSNGIQVSSTDTWTSGVLRGGTGLDGGGGGGEVFELLVGGASVS